MIEIKIPKLGLTMQSAKLVRWECKDGSEVKEGQIILVIETDKVTFEVPSPADGIIHPIVPEGETCAVEETVGYLVQNHAEYEQISKMQPPARADEAEKARLPSTAGLAPDSLSPAALRSSAAERKGRIKVSPLARSMAARHNLDLSTIRGSGPDGRIVKADIQRALEAQAPVVEKEVERVPEVIEKALVAKEALETITIQGARGVIFENMHQSLSQSAQLTLHTEASAESLVALRERLSKDEQRISYNAILLKIVAMALRQHPKINASVEGESIRVWKQIHIGLAMEANEALIVPVIRNTDFKTIREIERDISELVQKARENRFSPDDLVNGTFTISNLGFADVDHFTPIIRPPESGILGVGRIVKKPSVKDEQVVPEARIALSLTFDHRIIDGAPAARFLKTIKEMVEDPMMIIS